VLINFYKREKRGKEIKIGKGSRNGRTVKDIIAL